MFKRPDSLQQRKAAKDFNFSIFQKQDKGKFSIPTLTLPCCSDKLKKAIDALAKEMGNEINGGIKAPDFSATIDIGEPSSAE